MVVVDEVCPESVNALLIVVTDGKISKSAEKFWIEPVMRELSTGSVVENGLLDVIDLSS